MLLFLIRLHFNNAQMVKDLQGFPFYWISFSWIYAKKGLVFAQINSSQF